MRTPFGLRLVTSLCAFRLRRFLRRFLGAQFPAHRRPLIVGVGYVNVVPHRNRLGIAQPLRYNRQREVSDQVRFASPSVDRRPIV